MLETKCASCASPPTRAVVATNADATSPMSGDSARDEKAREVWRTLIDYKLIDLGCNSRQFEEEGIEPPSGEIVRLAINMAECFCDAGCPPPSSVVPDANGGIVFERRENGLSEVVHVWDDETVEYQRFQGTRLVERKTL